MHADPVFDRKLERLVRAVLEAESGPDPIWATSPAARRVTTTPRTRRRPWPLRLLAVAALLVVGGASVAGLIASRPSDPTPQVPLAYGIDGDIYLADGDGRNPVRIADGHSEAGCGPFEGNDPWLVAPDGRHLAYRLRWDSACKGAFKIVDPSGRVISTIPSGGWRLSWSPDGTRVATWSASVDGAVGIYRIDGELLAELDGAQACCGDHDPVWSPDGAESVLLPSRINYPDRFDVQELPVDGGTPRILPPDDPRSQTYALGWQPMVYSPDGTHAAFVDRPGSGPLIVVTADGTHQRTLVDGDVGEGPRWSPSGDRIAFVVALPTSVELRIVDVATGTQTTLAVAPRTASMQTFGFSPDGGHVLYGLDTDPYNLPPAAGQTGADDAPALWIASSDGSAARLVATGAPGTGVTGAWLPTPSDAEAP